MALPYLLQAGCALGVVFILVIGWAALAMSAHLDQRDEDRYGMDKARRS